MCLQLFLASLTPSLVWKYLPHSFSDFQLRNTTPQPLFRDELNRERKTPSFRVKHTSLLFTGVWAAYMHVMYVLGHIPVPCKEQFSSADRTELTRNCQILQLVQPNRRFVWAADGLMTLPCPGDVLRFGVSSAAAHQLGFLQTHEPVSCSSGDGGIWGVWDRNTDLAYTICSCYKHTRWGCFLSLFIQVAEESLTLINSLQRWDKAIVLQVTNKSQDLDVKSWVKSEYSGLCFES